MCSECDRPHYSRGLCSMHYQRLRRHGTTAEGRPQFGGVQEHTQESRRQMRASHVRHGATGTPEYAAWKDMIKRCTWPGAKQFRDWGGRGISVCVAWRNSFESFLADVGPRPSPELTLDRIDNDGNYEPGNVRWATRFEQTHNRRPRQRRAA